MPQTLKFEYKTEEGRVSLKGYGFEGTKTPKDNEIWFDYIPKERAHPDLIAFACYLSFWPFIRGGDTVEFPFPVSPRIQEAVNKIHYTYRGKEHVTVLNVDPKIEPRQTPENNTPVLLYGGGVDSLCVHTIMPEIPIIFIAGHNGPGLRIQKAIAQAPDYHIVTSNLRTSLNQPGNWPVSTAILVPALLSADDRKIGVVLSGANLDSLFMGAGTVWKSEVLKSPWFEVFESIGLPYFPISGALSVHLACRTLVEKGTASRAVYCEIKGGNCGRCFKCMRRQMGLKAWGYGDINWDSYNHSVIHELLEQRPVLYRNTMGVAIPHIEVPDWFTEKTGHIPDIGSSLNKAYVQGLQPFSHYPHYDELLSRILTVVEPMTEKDIQIIKGFHKCL